MISCCRFYSKRPPSVSLSPCFFVCVRLLLCQARLGGLRGQCLLAEGSGALDLWLIQAVAEKGQHAPSVQHEPDWCICGLI